MIFAKNYGEPDFLDSTLFAYDTKREIDMPSGFLITKDIRFDPISHGSNAFNVLSHINFNRQLVDEIKNILSILKDIINLVCDNHLLKAINCNKNYLPFRKQTGKIVLLTFLPLSNDDRQILISIGDKIIPNMNTQEINFTINSDMTSPEIIRSMTNEYC